MPPGHLPLEVFQVHPTGSDPVAGKIGLGAPWDHPGGAFLVQKSLEYLACCLSDPTSNECMDGFWKCTSVPLTFEMLCWAGRARRGDKAAVASRQRTFSSQAGEQTSVRVSGGSGTEAARAPRAAGRAPKGQGQDGGAFTVQTHNHIRLSTNIKRK